MKVFTHGHPLRRARIRTWLPAVCLSALIGLAGGSVRASEAADSPPTGRLAFAKYFDGQFEIVTLDLATGAEARLTTNPQTDSQPAFSADGTLIAFTRLFDVWLMYSDGSAQRNVTQNGSSSIHNSDPDFSPDGAEIAFVRNGDVAVMDAGGGNVRMLATESTSSAPAFSPDGSTIAFASNRPAGSTGIWLMNADGSGQRRLTSFRLGHDLEPSWSPDGSRVVFTSTRSGGAEVWAVDVASGAETKLVSIAQGNGADPWYSPDGTRIVFTAVRISGQSNQDLFLMNPDGTGQARLTTDVANEIDPVWAPPPPSLSIDSVTVTEGNAAATDAVLTVSLSAAVGAPVSVDFATVDGTAAAGSDYQARSGTLAFAPGETTRTIPVPIEGDLVDEANESFLVELSNPSGATASAGLAGVATIVDDDEPPPPATASDARVTTIAPSCADFVAGRAPDLGQVLYGVRGDGKIASLTPWAIRYWTAVRAPATSFTVEVAQAMTHPSFAILFDLAGTNQVRLHEANCRDSQLPLAVGLDADQARVTIAGATPGQAYFLSVRYGTQPFLSKPAPSPSDVHYEFATLVEGAVVDRDPTGLDLRRG